MESEMNLIWDKDYRQAQKCSVNKTFGGHFVYLFRLFIVKQLPILYLAHW